MLCSLIIRYWSIKHRLIQSFVKNNDCHYFGWKKIIKTDISKDANCKNVNILWYNVKLASNQDQSQLSSSIRLEMVKKISEEVPEKLWKYISFSYFSCLKSQYLRKSHLSFCDFCFLYRLRISVLIPLLVILNTFIGPIFFIFTFMQQ